MLDKNIQKYIRRLVIDELGSSHITAESTDKFILKKLVDENNALIEITNRQHKELWYLQRQRITQNKNGF
jgi:hypothetical protein